jgi:hypothetical protein
MAIIKHDGGGRKDAIFLQIDGKQGRFKGPDGALDANTAVEGLLHSFSVQQNLNKEKTTVNDVLRLRIVDPTDPKAQTVYVNINLTTARPVLADGKEREADDLDTPVKMTMKVLGKLNAADLSQPISIKPWLMEAGDSAGDFTAESNMTGVKISQKDGAGNWEGLKEDYGNGVTELPKPPFVMNGTKKIMVDGFPLTDKTVWAPLMEDLLDSVAEKTGQKQQEGQTAGNDDGVDMGEASAAAERAQRQQG